MNSYLMSTDMSRRQQLFEPVDVVLISQIPAACATVKVAFFEYVLF
jgi:hypothetical protein